MVICTEPFLNSAHMQARTFGRQGFLPVGIPHPLGGIDTTLVQQRASAIYDQVVKALTNGG